MISRLGSFTDEGLREYARLLHEQLSTNILWDDFALQPHGKLLIEQLRSDLNFWRGQYRFIDSGSPAANTLLAFIQGIDYLLERQLGRLVEAKDQADSVRKEMDMIREYLELKKKNQETAIRFTPASRNIKKGVRK